jgi:hypothetical protein
VGDARFDIEGKNVKSVQVVQLVLSIAAPTVQFRGQFSRYGGNYVLMQ